MLKNLKVCRLFTAAILQSVLFQPLIFQAVVAAPSEFESAIQSYKVGHYNTALPLLEKHLKSSPSDAGAHYYKGLCSQSLGRLSDAIAEYQWVATYSRDPQLKANAEIGLKQLGKYRSAGSSGTTGSVSEAPAGAAGATTSSPGTASGTRALGGASSSTPSAPAVRDALFSPKFNLKDGRSVEAGKAWCARLSNGQSVLVTALHLLGPAGGLDAQIPAAKLAAEVDNVELTSLTNGNSAGSTTTVLSKTGHVKDDDDYSGDMMVFKAPASISATKAFSIADQRAAVGERCWFYTCLVNESVPPQCLPGTVTESSDKRMLVKLDRRVETRATSGSPILDRIGRVIGMLSGHYVDSGDLLCNPGCAISKRIATDCAR